ncbi:MAG: FecR domain-containing protein, partial [Pseudomonadales bacterium]|nr:FecR domain-containing protein [Pseudomonadales bacterium]
MRSVVVAFVLLIGVSANTSFACENWVAKVVSTNGLVEIKEGSQSKSAEIDSVVCPGQVISVAANSRAALYLSNNSFVRLDQNTVLAFPKAPSDQGFWVQLQQGVSHFISRITQRFVVDAPYVNAAVDGTEFLVSAQGKESSVSVIEGQVTASNEGGQQVLTMGQKAVATGKASGFRLMPIQTEDVIDWAIYYSPLPVLQELQASDSDPVYQELIEQTQQQRPDLALQALQKQTLTESLRVADAALLMSVGQAEKALAQIESSTFTQALALKSVIFSSRNQSEKALDYAQKAVQQDSQSSAALLALSYAHQAALNLPEALQAAHQATL